MKDVASAETVDVDIHLVPVHRDEQRPTECRRNGERHGKPLSERCAAFVQLGSRCGAHLSFEDRCEWFKDWYEPTRRLTHVCETRSDRHPASGPDEPARRPA